MLRKQSAHAVPSVLVTRPNEHGVGRLPALPLLTVLRYKRSLAVGSVGAAVLFLFNERLMATLPMERNFACVVGGALTPLNIGFSALLSLLSGVIVAGVVELLWRRKKSNALATGSLSGVAASVGILTTFCTACTLPTLSLFGLSLGLGFLTPNNLLFKVVSLALLLVGLATLNRQLGTACARCGDRGGGRGCDVA